MTHDSPCNHEKSWRVVSFESWVIGFRLSVGAASRSERGLRARFAPSEALASLSFAAYNRISPLTCRAETQLSRAD